MQDLRAGDLLTRCMQTCLGTLPQIHAAAAQCNSCHEGVAYWQPTLMGWGYFMMALTAVFRRVAALAGGRQRLLLLMRANAASRP